MTDAGIVAFTLKMALASLALTLPAGVALGWLLARRRWPGKLLVETLVTLPLVLPPVATGLILLRAAGRRALVGRLYYRLFGEDVVFTWRAVVLAMAVMSLPFVVRHARVAFEEVNPRLEQMARSLGAGEGRVFVAVTVPLALRGLVGGAVLAFARAVGEFGATILVAGNIPWRTQTISLAIYSDIELGRDADATRLVVFSALIALAAVGVAEWVLRKGRGRA